MRLALLSAAVIAVTLAAMSAPGHAAGTDEPKPAPKPAPKPEPKPDSKDAPKAAPAASLDVDYVAGKVAVDARDWKRAIELFSRAAARDADNANIHNYLGFANRNDGNWELAMTHYRTALALNPDHGIHGPCLPAARQPATRPGPARAAGAHLRPRLRGIRKSFDGHRGFQAQSEIGVVSTAVRRLNPAHRME